MSDLQKLGNLVFNDPNIYPKAPPFDHIINPRKLTRDLTNSYVSDSQNSQDTSRNQAKREREVSIIATDEPQKKKSKSEMQTWGKENIKQLENCLILDGNENTAAINSAVIKSVVESLAKKEINLKDIPMQAVKKINLILNGKQKLNIRLSENYIKCDEISSRNMFFTFFALPVNVFSHLIHQVFPNPAKAIDNNELLNVFEKKESPEPQDKTQLLLNTIKEEILIEILKTYENLRQGKECILYDAISNGIAQLNTKIKTHSDHANIDASILDKFSNDGFLRDLKDDIAKKAHFMLQIKSWLFQN